MPPPRLWETFHQDHHCLLYTSSNPAVYTQAGHDRWEPHYMYIGEVVDAIEG